MKTRHFPKRLTHAIVALSLLSTLVVCASQSSVRAARQSDINIIPKPLEMKTGEGSFTIQPATTILVDADSEEVREIAVYLAERIETVTGYALVIKSGTAKGNADGGIVLTTRNADETLGDEGYGLAVTDTSVTITAPNAAGLFYGVQTIFQLLPPEIYSDKRSNKDIAWSIPALTVSDKPRYAWRGMHLDVARHFFSKESIKRYIDMLAMHKLNRLHMHLTDDQGWRIEIKEYPRLVEIGSHRPDFPWSAWQGKDVAGIPLYSGHYSQEEMKELVSYAQRRFITIVPEIEMPGHALAALAAYPEYSCTGGPFTVPSGGVDIWNNHTYCIGSEKTYEFLEGVLSEILELFPSKYIHIGGDETTRIRWEKCAKCQDRIAQEGLDGEDGLYGYFINRMSSFLDSQGRVLIGWDEILEGGENIDGTIMSWRGADRTAKAVKQRGLDVILAYSSHLYFGDIFIDGEPRLPLENVYSFNPVPEDFTEEDAKHILGLEACIWTEVVTSMKQVEKIALPRMAAVAEIAWSEQAQRNSEDFLTQIACQYDRYDAMNLSYTQPELQGGFNGTHVFVDSIKVNIVSPRLDSEVRYTLDGSDPTTSSLLYTKPFSLTETTKLKAREILSNGRMGRIRSGLYDKQKPIASVNVNTIQVGLHYQYGEGRYEHTNEMPSEYKKSGTLDHFSLPPNHRKHYFGVIYSGYVRVPEEGVYKFYTETNDGNQLYIGDRLVVDYGQTHTAEEKSGSIALQAGYHPIRVLYFQNAGASSLKISYEGVRIEKKEIPGSVLFH